jgi:hypothetical protein
VADIVDADVPTGAFAAPPEPPPEMKRQMEARGVDVNPFGQAGDDDAGVMFLSQRFSLRDRLGGDVQITEDDRQTSLSAIASVKPN